MKSAIGTRAPAVPARQLDARVERQQVGRAVAGRRGGADVAGERAAVLDLHAADLARGELQAVEQRRQLGADEVGPGGERADAPCRRLLGDAAQAGHGGDVEDVAVPHVAPAGARRLGRIDIGAARQHHHGLAARMASASSRRGRAVIGDHQPPPGPVGRARSATQSFRTATPCWASAQHLAYGRATRRSCRSSSLRRTLLPLRPPCRQRQRDTEQLARLRACSSRGGHRGRPASARARTDRRSRRRPGSAPRRGRRLTSGISWSLDRCSGMSVSPPRCTRTTLGAPSPPPCTPGGPKRPWSITNDARASPRSSSTS